MKELCQSISFSIKNSIYKIIKLLPQTINILKIFDVVYLLLKALLVNFRKKNTGRRLRKLKKINTNLKFYLLTIKYPLVIHTKHQIQDFQTLCSQISHILFYKCIIFFSFLLIL